MIFFDWHGNLQENHRKGCNCNPATVYSELNTKKRISIGLKFMKSEFCRIKNNMFDVTKKYLWKIEIQFLNMYFYDSKKIQEIGLSGQFTFINIFDLAGKR
jgi:hypothetical protein